MPKTENHVLPYEDSLQMAAEMVSRLGSPEEVEAIDFEWWVKAVPPKGFNLWRFNMYLLKETRTKSFG